MKTLHCTFMIIMMCKIKSYKQSCHENVCFEYFSLIRFCNNDQFFPFLKINVSEISIYAKKSVTKYLRTLELTRESDLLRTDKLRNSF